jgi:hypothetical protein
MIGSKPSRFNGKILFSASSLALLAASSAPILAQNDTLSPESQPPAVAPVPTSPTATPEPQQESATPAPQQQGAPATPEPAVGANVLPETRVVAPVERRQSRTRPPQVVANLPPASTQAQVVAKQNQAFDTARQNILTPLGAGTYQLNQQTIEALPQGANTGLDKVLLQAPGVTQDSAASGDLHVRN